MLKNKKMKAFISIIICHAMLFSMNLFYVSAENDHAKVESLAEKVSLSKISSDVEAMINLSANGSAKEISLDGYDDLCSVTLKNDDESCSLNVFGMPIKYINEKGEAVFKSNKLISTDKRVSLFNSKH